MNSSSPLLFISRMDKERADFAKAVESIRTRLGKKITICALPIGAESTFTGLWISFP